MVQLLALSPKTGRIDSRSSPVTISGKLYKAAMFLPHMRLALVIQPGVCAVC